MQILSSIIFSSLMVLVQACGANKSSISSPPSDHNKHVNEADKKDTYPVKEYIDSQELGSYSQAIFAGGCFWCTEAAFERISGVVDVISGYSGGNKEYPGYYEVGEGKTGHAEAIFIFYDGGLITYETLLEVFFVAHDPTTLNRQGPDSGEEYRSAIYFQTGEEQKLIDLKIKELNASDSYVDKIVTEVAPYKEFWVAESYHQNYYELNPDHGYVRNVSKPKVDKVIKTFPELIKLDYR